MIFNIDGELLLSLLLSGTDYADIIYDIRPGKYIVDCDSEVKELILK